MKKVLVLLLLLILPLQSAWAAASVYCQHEQGDVQHFGHHSHEHQAADTGTDSNRSPTPFHADCAACHLGGLTALTSPLEVPPASLTFPPDSAHKRLLPSAFLDGPERPHWPLAA